MCGNMGVWVAGIMSRREAVWLVPYVCGNRGCGGSWYHVKERGCVVSAMCVVLEGYSHEISGLVLEIKNHS